MYKLLKKLQCELNALIINFQKQKRAYQETCDAYEQKKKEFRYYSKRLRFNTRIQIASALFGFLFFIASTAYLWKIKQLTTISYLVLGSALYTFGMFGILGICKYYEIRDRMLRDKAFDGLNSVLDQRLVTSIKTEITEIRIKRESFEMIKGKVDAIVSKHARHLNIQAVPREDQEDLLLLLELCGSNYYMDMVMPILDMDNKELSKLTSPSQLN